MMTTVTIDLSCAGYTMIHNCLYNTCVIKSQSFTWYARFQ